MRSQKVSRASAMAALILLSVAVSDLGIRMVRLYLGSPPSSEALGAKTLTKEKRTFPVTTLVLVDLSSYYSKSFCASATRSSGGRLSVSGTMVGAPGDLSIKLSSSSTTFFLPMALSMPAGLSSFVSVTSFWS